MLVGIMSDSHGDHIMVRRALAIFDAANVAHVIHCGDVGGMPVFDELVGRPCTFVWGNTDPPAYGENGLSAYLDTVGIKSPTEAPTRVTLDGKTFAVFHGHERGFNAAIECLDVDYILHGHTHEVRDDRRGQTRIVNAGALHRARVKTVATLDTSTDELTSYQVSEK